MFINSGKAGWPSAPKNFESKFSLDVQTRRSIIVEPSRTPNPDREVTDWFDVPTPEWNQLGD